MPIRTLRVDNGRTDVIKITGVVPLRGQIGVWPKINVPDALMEPLFGGANLSESGRKKYLSTYAILDAAKIPLLSESLDASGLEYNCLYTADDGDGLASVAPYLVEMSSENYFTRRLFTEPEQMNGLWGVEHGVFIRSPHSLLSISNHLQNFVKLSLDNGGVGYFRFWSEAVLDYIGFFGGIGLKDKIFPECTLIWRSNYYMSGPCFVKTNNEVK